MSKITQNQLIKQRNKIILLIAVFIHFSTTYANNIAVSNVAIVGQNTSANFSLVQFDISWDNSWRTAGGPANWDAAWVFIKYRLKMQPTWNHATLHWVDGTGSGDGHTEPTGSDINSANDNGSNGAYGAFIHGNAPFAHGTVNYTGVKLRWDYGVDGLVDADSVELCVMAIEMVYIPQTAFYIGSGGGELNSFYKRPSTTTPYQITSEGALTISTTANFLYYATSGDHGTIPASFPKGFRAYYCMKYEITQAQYVAFLNKLDGIQAAARAFINNTNRHNLTGVPGAYATTVPYVACNYLNYDDVVTYLDWAALRPMTEFEFEKAGRGATFPAVSEFAWGTNLIASVAYTISGSGTAAEGIATNYSTTGLVGNSIYTTTRGSINGPLRVGIFAANGSNVDRVTSGSSYYGIMELSGNLWERVISPGNAAGRGFTGVQGDGEISPFGLFNTSAWGNYTGGGIRGGSWLDAIDRGRVSDRSNGLWGNNSRFNHMGGRGVRTAP